MSDEFVPRNPRTPQQVVDDLRRALTRMESLGVRMNPSGRLGTSLRILEEAVSGQPVNTRDRAQAHLDAWQITSIGRNLLGAGVPGVTEKLRLVVGDPLIAPTGGSSSPGRDAQFELYLAAEFLAGGAQVTIEEPDLVLHDGMLVIGIAAKRVKSPRQLDRRLDEARKQLLLQRNRVTHGFVALDVTRMSNPNGGFITSAQPPFNKTVAAELTRTPASFVEQAVRSWRVSESDRRLTCGVILVAAATQYIPTALCMTYSYSVRLVDFGEEFEHVRQLLGSIVSRSMSVDWTK